MTLPELVYQMVTDQTFIAQILQDPETVLMAVGLTQEEIEATLTVLQSELWELWGYFQFPTEVAEWPWWPRCCPPCWPAS